MGDPTRDDDERLLAWLRMRTAGSSRTAIAVRYGVSEMAVRVATNRVRTADRSEAADYDPAADWMEAAE